MIRVLFVCLGNICRSPMAEAVLRHKIAQEGLSDRIEVDSAGTGGWHIGEAPHPGTRKKLREIGISDQGIFARLLTANDLWRFDYIVGMDEENLEDIRRLSTPETAGRIFLLADFVPGRRWSEGRTVPDPWYTGEFDLTCRLVSDGCSHLLAYIRSHDF